MSGKALAEAFADKAAVPVNDNGKAQDAPVAVAASKKAPAPPKP
jgi:hypothetical protein